MSQFAAALSWVPMSRILAATMARACDYATQQAHRQVTLEHLLLALTDDADAHAVLAVSNVDLGQLGADVATHVSRNDNRFAQAEAIDPAADETLVRILDYAAAAARQSRRREINGAVVLAAIIGDGNSSAATILKAQGLTFEAAIKALQKSNAQPKPATPVAPLAEPAPPPVIAAVATAPVAAPPAPTELPEAEADHQPPTIAGAATHANETMLANVRRKLEATRAAGPARPTIAPIAPLVPTAPPEAAQVAAASEPPELIVAPVDESAGLAALVKTGGKTISKAAAITATPPSIPPTIPPPIPQGEPVIAPPLPPPDADSAGSVPMSTDQSSPPPVTAGADLARKHDGWLPPPSPTLVTEATKPARRTPPVPPVEHRPPPLPSPLPPTKRDDVSPASDYSSSITAEDLAHQPPEHRVTQDAGPPRSSNRPPAPAPWPESVPGFAPPKLRQPQNVHGHDGGQSTRPTQLRDFHPSPMGAVPGPDSALHQAPYAPYPQQHGGGRTGGTAPPPGYVQGHPFGPTGGPTAGPTHGQWPANPLPSHPGPNQSGPNQSGQGLAQNGQRPQQQPLPQRVAPTITATVGKLTGPIPTKWSVAGEQSIEIGLSADELRALAQQLDGRGAAYAHERVVAKALSVRLKAPDHSFAIEPTSPETLWLDAQTLHMSNDGVHWRWQATPQTSGKKKLHLLISARTIGGDGVVAETALPDQSVTVKVGGNPGRFAMKLLGYLALLALGAVLARYGEGGIETLMAWKRGFQ
jgi:neural Wiskott-Aldrich syndrome protein